MSSNWIKEQNKIRNNFYARCCSLKLKSKNKEYTINQFMGFDANAKQYGFGSRRNIMDVYFEGSTNYSSAKIKYVYEDKRGRHECCETFNNTQSMIDYIIGFNQAIATIT
jgi:hypothetical protein